MAGYAIAILILSFIVSKICISIQRRDNIKTYGFDPFKEEL